MAATIKEHMASRSEVSDASGKRATRVYRIFDTADNEEAHTLLAATAPSTHTVRGSAVPLARTRIEPDEETIDEDNNVGIWIGTCEYAFPGNSFSPPETDTAFFNFEAQTSEERIFKSLNTKARHSANDDGAATDGATDYGGLINVTDDGVEGVNVLAPKFSFSMTAFVDDDDLQSAISDIASSIAKTNDASFQGFDAGEVLFVSASGSRRADQESWEINFGFLCSPNREDIDIDTPLAPSGAITVAEKKGWDYIWSRSVPYTDPDTGRLGSAVEAVYVEEVYESADFSLLPIPE